MNRLSVRLRVTLAFAAVMAIVLAAIGLFLYLRLSDQLSESIDNGLRSRATEVSALVREEDARLSGDDADPLIEQDESFAQILRSDGSVIDSSAQLAGVSALTSAQVSAVASGPTLFEVERVPGLEGAVRVLAVPVEADDGERIVVVGASLGDRDEALTSLARLLAIGGPLGLLLASVAGYGMAAAALRPVEAMRREAEAISSDPGQRLPVSPANDELSRLGETLNAMLARLDSALERERRFVDDASHELRTPLALHKTELEVALMEAGDEHELRAAISSAVEEIDRLIALAEALLVVARSENEGLALAPAEFDLGDALEAIVERFRARAERGGRQISFDPPAGNVELSGDRSRIEQALTNLVDNALRHGDGPIRVWAVEREASVELHVTDRGPGFPDEFIGHAFERFSRADVARGRGGSGLGLAIVDAIARAHGGSAHAGVAPGGGADVWIELPIGGGGLHGHFIGSS